MKHISILRWMETPPWFFHVSVFVLRRSRLHTNEDECKWSVNHSTFTEDTASCFSLHLFRRNAGSQTPFAFKDSFLFCPAALLTGQLEIDTPGVNTWQGCGSLTHSNSILYSSQQSDTSFTISRLSWSPEALYQTISLHFLVLNTLI